MPTDLPKLADIEAIADPIERYRAAQAGIAAARARQGEYAQLSRSALGAVVEKNGGNQAEVARILGVSRAAVGNALKSRPA